MPLPNYLRYKQLEQRNLVKSREQLKNLQLNHGFPLGRWLSPNCRIWTEEEVSEWVDSRPVATDNKPVIITENHISRRTRRA